MNYTQVTKACCRGGIVFRLIHLPHIHENPARSGRGHDKSPARSKSEHHGRTKLPHKSCDQENTKVTVEIVSMSQPNHRYHEPDKIKKWVSNETGHESATGPGFVGEIATVNDGPVHDQDQKDKVEHHGGDPVRWI
jgi:hypothetical protein